MPAEASVSLPRALSKLGACSRAEAEEAVIAGRVRVNGRRVIDPALRVDVRRDRLELDGAAVVPVARVYLALHKPAGLVTTASDERGRATVFSCFADALLPRIVPVGRLDKDSEGLLLFTNDTRWADRIAAPATHVDKIYVVSTSRAVDAAERNALLRGVVSRQETLAAKRVRALPALPGEPHRLEIVLDEGRNRHIRRMLEGIGVGTTRLVRIAIGPIELGDLGPGNYRHLTPAELRALEKVISARGRAGESA